MTTEEFLRHLAALRDAIAPGKPLSAREEGQGLNFYAGDKPLNGLSLGELACTPTPAT